jgi:hypothetical protein
MDAFEPGATEEFLVQGEDYGPTTVPVEVCGPVETRELSARNSSMRGVYLLAGTAVKIAGHDGRRKSLRVLAWDVHGTCLAVQIGNSKNEAEGAYAFVLPLVLAGTASASVLLPVNSISEVWAMAVTKDCIISVVSESWI